MYSFKNFSEDIVHKILFQVLENYPDICKCDKCIADMMALSLNCVKPKYVVSEVGEIYTKALNEIDKQELISITACVVTAVETVSKNLKH